MLSDAIALSNLSVFWSNEGRVLFHHLSFTVEHVDHVGTNLVGIILHMRPAIERRRCIVTSSLIGWAHAQFDPYGFKHIIYFSPYIHHFSIHLHCPMQYTIQFRDS